VYQQFKSLQSSFQLNKYYLAEVYGDFTPLMKRGKYVISYPIAHHKFNPDRMVVVKQENDLQKIK
jgi:hypothetical protein